MHRVSILATIALFSFSVPLSAQKIYKCVDEDGAVTFSQLQCEQDQSESVFKSNPSGPKDHPANQYVSFDEIQQRFHCNTPRQGLKVFPSRKSIVDTAQNSLVIDEEIGATVSVVRKKLGLRFSDMIPSGRSCFFSYNRGHGFDRGLTVLFRASNASEGFLEMEEMHKGAEDLGYPVKLDGPVDRQRESFYWEEKGLGCKLGIADIEGSPDSSMMKVNCEAL